MQQGAEENIGTNWRRRINTLLRLEILKKGRPLEGLSADGWARVI
jgi:hypothetical protein